MKKVFFILTMVMISMASMAQSAAEFYNKGTKATTYKQKHECFLRAANMGHLEAMFIVGEYYRCGKGVDTNRTEAVRWYRKAAERGHAQAQKRLGLCYYHAFGVKEDIDTAGYWMKKAMAQGLEITDEDLMSPREMIFNLCPDLMLQYELDQLEKR